MSAFGWYRPWLTSVQASCELPTTAKAMAAGLATSEGRPPLTSGRLEATAAQLGSPASLEAKAARAALRKLEAGGWIEVRRTRYGYAVRLLEPYLAEAQTGPSDRTENGRGDRSPVQIGPSDRSQNGRRDRPDRTPRPPRTVATTDSPTGPTATREGPRTPARTSAPTRPRPHEGDHDPTDRLAEHIRGRLQSAVDGLTTTEPCKPPTSDAIAAALRHICKCV